MNARIALTLSPKGIDTISFVSCDKKESLIFFLLVQEEIEVFEERIKALIDRREVTMNGFEESLNHKNKEKK